MNNNKLEKQFKEIENLSNQQNIELAKMNNMERKTNRYFQVVPYQYNCVRLSDKTYINASFIKLLSQKQKFDNTLNFIIASQAPLQQGFGMRNFYVMLFQQKIQTIFLLGSTQNRQIDIYWPQKQSQMEIANDLKIKNITLINLKSFTKIQIEIKYKKQTHILNLYQYFNWPDRSVPKQKESLLQLLQIAYNIRLDYKKILVHCSAGIGRTGTFLTLLDLFMRKKLTLSIDQNDIKKCILNLRKQRKGCVQTLDQYVYIKQFSNTISSYKIKIINGKTSPRSIKEEVQNYQNNKKMEVKKLINQLLIQIKKRRKLRLCINAGDNKIEIILWLQARNTVRQNSKLMVFTDYQKKGEITLNKTKYIQNNVVSLIVFDDQLFIGQQDINITSNQITINNQFQNFKEAVTSTKTYYPQSNKRKFNIQKMIYILQ